MIRILSLPAAADSGLSAELLGTLQSHVFDAKHPFEGGVDEREVWSFLEVIVRQSLAAYEDPGPAEMVCFAL